MLTHKRAIVISGFIWLIMGSFLFYKGITLMFFALKTLFSHTYQGFSLILWMAALFGDLKRGIIFLFFLSFFIGFIKGRFVLCKTVKRVVLRIKAKTLPLSLCHLYSKGDYVLIGCMALMGMSFKFLPIPLDVIGTVDLIIGSALVNGATLYFREALILKKSLESSTLD